MTPEARRQAVTHLRTAHRVSERRACEVLRVDRSTVRYKSRRGDDADLRDANKRVSRERRRLGYRCIHVMLEREGYKVNDEKLRRINAEQKLQVRRRGGRKRAPGTGEPRWCCAGWPEPALVADTSLSGLRVKRELDRVIAARGLPGTIVSDIGTEFTGMAILKTGAGHGYRLALHRPRKAAAERFHRELQRKAPR